MGMPDALRAVELLSEAIDNRLDGQRLDQVLANEQCKRMAAVLSMYELRCGEATSQRE